MALQIPGGFSWSVSFRCAQLQAYPDVSAHNIDLVRNASLTQQLVNDRIPASPPVSGTFTLTMLNQTTPPLSSSGDANAVM